MHSTLFIIQPNNMNLIAVLYIYTILNWTMYKMFYLYSVGVLIRGVALANQPTNNQHINSTLLGGGGGGGE